jgi:hypothetical protein
MEFLNDCWADAIITIIRKTAGTMPYEKRPECYVTELNRNRIRIYLLDDEKKIRHYFPYPQNFTGVVFADLQRGNCPETDACEHGA